MPKWVSKDGVCVPSKERVALTDKNGEPYIYEGPDRAAVEYLKEQGVESLGVHFSQDPELIARVRQIHNISMKEYMDMCGYDENTTRAKFDKHLNEVNIHENPARKPGLKPRTGGINTAGEGHYAGDFGDPKATPVDKK